MKTTTLIFTVVALALAPISRAADAKPEAKAKPYALKTCVVSDEKLGGDMGDPYVFKYQGREVKLCCKGCLDDFNKEPAKFLKKLDVAEKKDAPKK